MATVKCTSEWRTTEQLEATFPFTQWVTSLPSDAILQPITVDKGSQRDPMPVLVGLRATWEEER